MVAVRSSVFLACAFTLGACAVSAEGEPGETAATHEDALRGAKVYDCRGPRDVGDTLARFQLEVTSTKAVITDVSKDAAPPDTGAYDASYRPTSATYRNSARYTGYATLPDALSSDVSTVDLIVSEALKNREGTGKAWIRTAGPEGGDTTSYFCSEKPAPLAIDTATKARLACSLDHLVCNSGPAPGDSCLADAFLMQGTSDATLRLSWLDHFGVRATERREPLGDSTTFSRRATRITGDWAGNKVSLTYRAGLTYVGKVTLADGRSETIKCNDLAMFD